MAKALTSDKAKKILKDGSVHGHPLTAKQKGLFGAIAGGQKPYSQAKKAANKASKKASIGGRHG